MRKKVQFDDEFDHSHSYFIFIKNENSKKKNCETY